VRPGFIAAAAIVFMVWTAGVARSVSAQASSDRTIWGGVFSGAQASRGKAAFETSCGRCHNNELIGSERGPALKGDGFWTHWDNDTLNTLFTKIRDTMPAGGIESVTDAGKLDILAYILSANGAAAGNTELTLEPAVLDSITIVKQGSTSG
jgi:mono/diheme cytochrome c family protein